MRIEGAALGWVCGGRAWSACILTLALSLDVPPLDLWVCSVGLCMCLWICMCKSYVYVFLCIYSLVQSASMYLSL